MAYVKVAASRNIVGAIRYLQDSPSHDGIHARIGAFSTQHLSFSHARYEAVETLRRFDKDKGFVQAQLVIQSFHNDELNPDSQDDLDKANKVGHELAKELFGDDRQFLVVTQADNGNVHNHIVAVSPDLKGRSLRGAATGFKRTREVSDMVCAAHGIKNLNADVDHIYTDKKSMAEVKRSEAGLYVWKDDLKQRIREALEDVTVTDEAVFTDKLMTSYGVDVRFRGKGVSYAFTDADGKKRVARGKTLGTIYAKEGLDYGFADNIKQQEQQLTGLGLESLDVGELRSEPGLSGLTGRHGEAGSETAEPGQRDEGAAEVSGEAELLARQLRGQALRREREQRQLRERASQARARRERFARAHLRSVQQQRGADRGRGEDFER